MLDIKDVLAIVHPALAVVIVFPLIGIVVYMALQTRQRRLQVAVGEKSKIPPIVGQEHVKLGRWLSGAVVSIALIGLAYPIFSKIIEKQTWTQDPLRVFFVIAMFIAAIVCLGILFTARSKAWRGIFATLTGMAVVLLGCQPEVFRRGDEWYVSHYYIGMSAIMLMIFSLAIIQDIYQDRKNRWRTVHVVLNCVALLLFISQGVTGSRDLLEIPLSWQSDFLGQCDWANKTCPTQK
jgi:MFS family permease